MMYRLLDMTFFGLLEFSLFVLDFFDIFFILIFNFLDVVVMPNGRVLASQWCLPKPVGTHANTNHSIDCTN